jgi:hypothetical protein
MDITRRDFLKKATLLIGGIAIASGPLSRFEEIIGPCEEVEEKPAWAVPPVQSRGYLLTASDWNKDIADNLLNVEIERTLMGPGITYSMDLDADIVFGAGRRAATNVNLTVKGGPKGFPLGKPMDLEIVIDGVQVFNDKCVVKSIRTNTVEDDEIRTEYQLVGVNF